MATSEQFAQFICDQLEPLGDLRIGKMFGEYGLWWREKFVALICGDQLYIKNTPQGREFWPDCPMAPPYKGASDYFLVEDPEEISRPMKLLEITWKALPMPKPKRKKGGAQ